ncbi:MAG TPA: hypothetical protein VMH41_07785, partial [Mycobacteriales bacterium]|nr:hypothetical protein [Mycobacteriales bacterium]
MKKSVVAVGTALTMALAGAAAPAALAQGHTPHAKASAGLKVSVSPSKPKSGDTVHATLSGGKKGVNYVCVFTTFKKGTSLGASDAYTNSAQTNIKAKHGKAHCSFVFLPFKVPAGHSCPPSKADKKKGWKCGVAF